MFAHERISSMNDLFDSDDFPGSVRNLDEAAKIVVQRPIDSGFDIKPWEPNR